MATVLDVSGDVSNDETVKKLGEMMSEYLNFKKFEREVSICNQFFKICPLIVLESNYSR